MCICLQLTIVNIYILELTIALLGDSPPIFYEKNYSTGSLVAGEFALLFPVSRGRNTTPVPKEFREETRIGEVHHIGHLLY